MIFGTPADSPTRQFKARKAAKRDSRKEVCQLSRFPPCERGPLRYSDPFGRSIEAICSPFNIRTLLGIFCTYAVEEALTVMATS